MGRVDEMLAGKEREIDLLIESRPASLGADLDEAKELTLMYFWRHPNSAVGTASIFNRRLRSLQINRARASTFESGARERMFKCRTVF